MRSRCLLVSLFTILFALFLVGCAGDAFRAARVKNTVTAYDQFLQEYGDSEFVPQARKLREDLILKKNQRA